MIKKKHGFSLMEMMVALLVVAVVAAATAPMISKHMVRNASKENSPWMWVGNNTVFNVQNKDLSALIGTMDDSSGGKLIVKSILKTKPHLVLKNNNYDLSIGFGPSNQVWMSDEPMRDSSSAVAIGHGAVAGVNNSSTVLDWWKGSSALLSPKCRYKSYKAVAHNNTTAYTECMNNCLYKYQSDLNGRAECEASCMKYIQSETIDPGAIVDRVGSLEYKPGVIFPEDPEDPPTIIIGDPINGDNPVDRIYEKNNGPGTTAIGSFSKASKHYATALGYGANATESNSTAIGIGSVAGSTQAIAIGVDAKVTGSNSTAIGAATEAIGINSIAIGLGSKTNVGNSIAIGVAANAAGSNNTASAAIGYNARAIANASIAMGTNASSKSENSVAIGTHTEATGSHSVAIGSGSKTVTVHTLGSKQAGTNSKKTMKLRTSASGENSSAYGHLARATESNSTAIGTESAAVGANSAAIGHGAYAGLNSISAGNGAKASANNSVAIGDSALANDNAQVAIGIRAKAYGVNSVVIGPDAQAGTVSSTDHATAVGTDAKATGENSAAFGYKAEATGVNSVAIGQGAKSSYDNVIVLGTENSTVYIPGSLIVGRNTFLGKEGTGYRTFIRNKTNGNNNWHLYSIEINSGSNNDFRKGENAANKASMNGTDANLFEKFNNDKYSSDRRLKNVGEVFTGGLAELKRLELFHYTYKNDENKTPHVGVMAQDLQKIFPDAVIKGEDGFLKIRLEDMFYAVINAVKELDARLEVVQAQVKSNLDIITKLQATVDSQKEEIIELKKQNSDILNKNAEFEKRLAKLEKKSVKD